MSDALDKLFSSPLSQPPSAPAPAVLPIVEEKRNDALIYLSPKDLSDFPMQPFKPYSPEKLDTLRESIEKNGIIEPLIVRQLEGAYQIVSGHNRRTAAALSALSSLPCIVRTLSDDDAALQMLETNLEKRDDLLPSEKAKAYRMRMDILAHQSNRSDLTSRQVVGKLESEACGNGCHPTSGQLVGKSRDAVSDGKIKGRQVQNYVRLSYLSPELLELVDAQKLTMRAGVELAFLSPENQQAIHHFFYLQRFYPVSDPIAHKLRELGQEKELSEADLLPFLSPTVKPFRKVSVSMKPIRRYFSQDATPKEVEQTIVAALTAYFKEAHIVRTS